MKQLLFLISALMFAGCSIQQSPAIKLDPIAESGQTDFGLPALKPDQIDFKVVNEQIFSKACVSCHSERGGNKGKLNMESFKNVFEKREEIRKRVFEKTMPPVKRPELALSEAQIKFIIDWIDNGAREDVNGPVPQPPVVNPPPVIVPPVVIPPMQEIFFAEIFEKVIKTNCLKCHSVAGGLKGDISFETYQGIADNLKDIKLDVESNDMPPIADGGTALTVEQKNLISAWLSNGAPEKAKEVKLEPEPQTKPATVVEIAPVKVNIYFAEVFEKVIKVNCLKCHSVEGGDRGDINLETYANVFENRFDIKSDVELEQMPPKPPKGAPLSDEQKKIVADWLAQGAVEKAVQ